MSIQFNAFRSQPQNQPPSNQPNNTGISREAPKRASFPYSGHDIVSTSSQPGGSVPTFSLFANENNQDLQSRGQELQYMLTHADEQVLARYGLGVSKDAKGQILSIHMDGQPVTYYQAQQRLAAHKGSIRNELAEVRQHVDVRYQDFATLANQVFNQLNPTEQMSVRILLQTINVLYSGFVNRVAHLDAMATSASQGVLV